MREGVQSSAEKEIEPTATEVLMGLTCKTAQHCGVTDDELQINKKEKIFAATARSAARELIRFLAL